MKMVYEKNTDVNLKKKKKKKKKIEKLKYLKKK